MPSALGRRAFDPWLATICAARTLLYANFMVFAACLPLLRQAWDITYAQAGAVGSGFILGYALSLLGSSWAADHFGARRIAVISALLSAVSAMAFGFFADSYQSALVLYTLAGLTQGGTYTPIVMLLADRYDRSRRGAAIGWLIASTSVGYAASLALAALAIAVGGYRMAFIVTGMMPAAGAALLLWALRDTENRIHPRPLHRRLWPLLKANRPARQLLTGYVGHSWELLGMWAWMPAFLTTSIAAGAVAGVGETGLGASIAAVMHTVGAVAASSMGRLSDSWGRRNVLLLLAGLSTAISCGIGWTVAWPIGVVVAIALVHAFATIGDSPVLSTAITEVIEPGQLGVMLALRSMLGFGAGAIAPYAFGLVLDTAGGGGTTAWGMSFMVLGMGGIVAVIFAWRLEMPENSDGAAASEAERRA